MQGLNHSNLKKYNKFFSIFYIFYYLKLFFIHLLKLFFIYLLKIFLTGDRLAIASQNKKK